MNEFIFKVTESAADWRPSQINRRLMHPNTVQNIHALLSNCGLDAHEPFIMEIIPGNSEVIIRKYVEHNLDSGQKVG